jgi:hypothetical protein
MDLESLFDITSKNAVVIGTDWPLCETVCRTLAQRGLCVIVLDDKTATATAIADKIIAEGGQGLALPATINHSESLCEARDSVLKIMGQMDILITGLTNKTDSEQANPWPQNFERMQMYSDVFGQPLARQKRSHILHIMGTDESPSTSGHSSRLLSNNLFAGYTHWLSRYMNENYGKGIHTNSIFMRIMTGKNKSNREAQMANELIGTLIWLLSSAADSINGLTVPIESNQ